VACALVMAVPAVASGATDLQSLIDSAAPGTVVTVPAGTYIGGIVIDKPITLVGEGAAVVDGGGTGTVISVEADDVTIKGIAIRGSGISLNLENAGVSVRGSRFVIEDTVISDTLFGIYLRESRHSIVRNNRISGKDLPPERRGDAIRLWESDHTTVTGNTVERGRDVVLWYSEGLELRDNVIRDGRYGLHFMYSDDATVEGNSLIDNSVGAFLMYSRRLVLIDNEMRGNDGPSGYGVGLKDMDGVEAHGNRFVGNRVGIYLDNSPWSREVEQHFTSNLIAYNDVGVLFLPSVKRNVFTANTFVDNREQVGVKGSGVLRENTWTVDGVGNYWSDFAGYDADGDGIGDIAYRIEDLFGSLTDRHPELLLLSGTPSARLVDAAAKAFPSLKPDPKVVDSAPLIVPLDRGASAQRSIGMLITGLGMWLAAGLVVGAARRKVAA